MTVSKVYFSDFRTPYAGIPIPDKFAALIEKAGMGDIDFKNKFVAIKIHFGEMGNVSYLRHFYARIVSDFIKSRGGKPFLTDCNTLYVGKRKDAIEHMETAYLNGYNPLGTGCHVIIGDGLKGLNETLVTIDGDYVKEARIGAAIMEADIVISLSHFKGHEATGFGGTIKNIGMGCGSRAGKMDMHSSGKPQANRDECIGCHACADICAHDAIVFPDGKAYMNHDICVGCGRCLGACPVDAVEPPSDHAAEVLCCKIAEYAWAVIKGRPHFHINVISDVSPFCDCHFENDAPIVPNIGMFASFDPVAIDRACVDACNAAPVNPGSILGECEHRHGDHFLDVNPNAKWKECLEHAAKMGAGTEEYELITL